MTSTQLEEEKIATPIKATDHLNIFQVGEEEFEVRDLQGKIVAGHLESLNLAYVIAGMISEESISNFDYPLHPDVEFPAETTKSTAASATR